MLLVDPTGAERPIPVDDGRAVFFGQHAGFYTLKSAPTADGAASEAAPYSTEFAANLADPVESQILPQKELKVGPTIAGEISGFSIGVRREFWSYLLLAVVAISAIEWLTFHRRVTV